MVELVVFFVRCCGCKAAISLRDFQTKEASEVIRALTENFAEVQPAHNHRHATLMFLLSCSLPSCLYSLPLIYFSAD